MTYGVCSLGAVRLMLLTITGYEKSQAAQITSKSWGDTDSGLGQNDCGLLNLTKLHYRLVFSAPTPKAVCRLCSLRSAALYTHVLFRFIANSKPYSVLMWQVWGGISVVYLRNDSDDYRKIMWLLAVFSRVASALNWRRALSVSWLTDYMWETLQTDSQTDSTDYTVYYPRQ